MANLAGQRLYAKRAGVEGAISQGVRAFGLRQARYRGLAKTMPTDCPARADRTADRYRDGHRPHPSTLCPGFQDLVAAVSLGQVGIIFAYEASRLARNNTDWYTLLDLATLVGTLIADIDGVYDPRQYNDRLLLGLRGILSEADLHLLQLRMAAGRQRQIERGTYRQHLPTGLVRLADHRVIKDPDRAV